MNDVERNEAAEVARKKMYDGACELLNASLSEDLAATVAASVQRGVRVSFELSIPGGDLVVRLHTRRDTHELLRAVTRDPVCN